MSESAGLRQPALCPYLYYEDVPAVMDWLNRAFGFRERMRITNADGSVGHAEMELGDAVIMMGSPPGYKSAAALGQVTSSMYVQVKNVDEHYSRARREGAGVLREPTDQEYGERNCGVTDPEGQHWWFAQQIEP